MNLNDLRNNILGYGHYFEGPFGKRLITYADYTASGKAVSFLETYFLELNKTYANTHTEDDFTGRYTTHIYHDAKNKIRYHVGADENYCVFPTGTGATGAIEKLTKILGIYQTPEYRCHRAHFLNTLTAEEKQVLKSIDEKWHQERPLVFISAFEHHSNEIQWREGYAEVIKIGLTADGLFDLDELIEKVSLPEYRNRKKIGSFSAASNITGIKLPIYDIARVMHQVNGIVFFDFAACGPYVKIDMIKDEQAYFDGIYLSMHKFLGGPGSSGLLILNKAIYNKKISPCSTGGGTVQYVTHNDHRYLLNYEDREAAGTPGIFQVIRAAMAFELKNAIGIETIEKIEQQYITQAINRLSQEDSLQILGNTDPHNRLAILSFNITYKNGYLHHGFISTLLNDLFGIQSRAGCACAGPYGICLLNIDNNRVERFKEALHAGVNALKPGWTRVNFHYTLDQETFDYIIEAIIFVARFGHFFLKEYLMNPSKGTWTHKDTINVPHTLQSIESLIQSKKTEPVKIDNIKSIYQNYLTTAQTKLNIRIQETCSLTLYDNHNFSDLAWFYHEKQTT